MTGRCEYGADRIVVGHCSVFTVVFTDGLIKNKMSIQGHGCVDVGPAAKVPRHRTGPCTASRNLERQPTSLCFCLSQQLFTTNHLDHHHSQTISLQLQLLLTDTHSISPSLSVARTLLHCCPQPLPCNRTAQPRKPPFDPSVANHAVSALVIPASPALIRLRCFEVHRTTRRRHGFPRHIPGCLRLCSAERQRACSE